MRNKRGQFFLVMVVIIAAIFLSAIALFNSSRTGASTAEKFNLVCENYYYEVQELEKDCILEQDCNFSEKLKEFTEYFLQNHYTASEIETIYVYGKLGDIEKKVCKETCQDDEYSGASNEFFGRTFTFYDYNTFHFVMKQVRGDEEYYCEK